MSDNDTTQGGGNVFAFPRIGFALTPTTTLPDPGAGTGPDTTDVTAASLAGPRTRRSPLNALTALPDPGLTTPLIPYTQGHTPAPGVLPDTFRGEPAPDLVGPRLGALCLAAILAVAVAAMRGTATYLQDRRERHLARTAETDPLRQARLKHQLAMRQAGYDRQLAGAKHSTAMHSLGDKAAQQRAKTDRKVPSSTAFGSKSLSGRSGTGSGSGLGHAKSGGTGGSSGSSRNGLGGLKNTRGGQGSKDPKRQKKNGSLFPGGSGAGGAGKASREKKPGYVVEPKKPKAPKGPHRSGQGAGSGLLKRNGKGAGSSGSAGGDAKGKHGRTGLPESLKDSTQKAAARRLKRRRNNLNSPALWGNKPGGKNQQIPNAAGGKGKGRGGANGKRVNLNKPQPSGRVHLGQALRKSAVKTARKRLKQRRRHPGTPPIWSAGGNQNQKAAGNGPTAPQSGQNPGTPKSASGGKSKNNGRAQAKARGKKRGAQQRSAWWASARAKTAGKGKNNTGQAPPKGWARWEDYQQYLRDQHNHRMGYNSQRSRRSPFENAGHAAGQAAGATYTFDRPDRPGTPAETRDPNGITPGAPALPATGPAALDAAPGKTFPRPGTTRPKEARPMPPAPARQDPRIAKAKKQAARTGRTVTAQAQHMDPQHETEITLDDAIDEYGDFKDDAFKTHDQCLKLAERARTLRDTLAAFAEELAVKNNLIGFLFTGAMARLSESMDLLARMADEMQTSSLEAAEMAETADNELNDAYRPYSIATADAGLSTPSAPVHNQT